MQARRMLSIIAAAILLASSAAWASGPPWMNRSLPPGKRAALLEARMSQAQKFHMIVSTYGDSFKEHGMPAGGNHSAGFVTGIPALGIPALQETDAGVGVAKPHPGGEGAIALPSGLASAASWDPDLARAGGVMIGRESHAKGFDVQLAGGLDLVRDPRNGRNFEYAGEDPLLAGTMVAGMVRGIQSQHVISTVKHYAFNDQESGRHSISAEIGHAAARESDLMAFRIAVEQGHPGSVMCAYNRVNGDYACENKWLLDTVLKKDWGYKGFVMSDWGAVHSTVKAALAGLDQESAASDFDKRIYFGKPLGKAIAAGKVPQSRVDDMVRRILTAMFAVGLFDHPPARRPINFTADRKVAQRAEEAGAVLLRNRDGLLPLSGDVKSIAVIGTHADKGVISGGGSSTVRPPGGNAVSGGKPEQWPGPPMYLPSPPLTAIQAQVPRARVSFNEGTDPVAAAKAAAGAEVAVVFVHQWMAESFDRPGLHLPGNQDALVEAVAAANPRTIVVLENGGPVAMPWLHRVAAVLEAWYPGAGGGPAIARLLFGKVNPSGHSPVTFPASLEQLPRPDLPGASGPFRQGRPTLAVDYTIEGADVGYRWYQKRGLVPMFPFGFGLGYTRFRFSGLRARVRGAGKQARLVVDFEVENTGSRAGAAVPQVYAAPPGGDTTRRLAGWARLQLAPGQRRHVELTLATLPLAHYDAGARRWRLDAGSYRVALAHDAASIDARATVKLPSTMPLRTVVGVSPAH